MSHITVGTPALESSSRLFRCKKGHSIRQSVPVTIGYYADASKGPPICPVCIAEFCRENFPMEEVEKVAIVPTQVGAVEAVMPAHTPAVRMCQEKGCILGEHDTNQKHIGVNRQPF